MDPSNTTNMPPIAPSTSNTPTDAAAQRLARKAASARQARARHKNAVSDMEDEVRSLSQRLAALEEQRLAAANAASAQLREELRAALPPERFQTLRMARAPPRREQQRRWRRPELLLCALKSGAESASRPSAGRMGATPARRAASAPSAMAPPRRRRCRRRRHALARPSAPDGRRMAAANRPHCRPPRHPASRRTP